MLRSQWGGVAVLEVRERAAAADAAAYEFSEAEARAKRIRLWRHDEPMQPWEWRKAQREK